MHRIFLIRTCFRLGDTTMSEVPKNKPVFSIKVGGIEAATWEQTSKNGAFLTVSINRNYKDKDGSWKKTNTYRINDLPQIQLAIAKCYEDAKLNHKTETPSNEDNE